MIQTYSIDYRTQLCEFFSRIIESHKAYISHGELQMGIALESNEPVPPGTGIHVGQNTTLFIPVHGDLSR